MAQDSKVPPHGDDLPMTTNASGSMEHGRDAVGREGSSC
uniref:Uncharacterized protein n=1 Tax=uncultured bacterium NM_1663 TaxID=1630017 RepID=A0A0E3GLX4_9BACT|nr:hypothetical protein [uncultured bacterium NM_1663]